MGWGAAVTEINASPMPQLRVATPKDLIYEGGTGQEEELQNQLWFVWGRNSPGNDLRGEAFLRPKGIICPPGKTR